MNPVYIDTRPQAVNVHFRPGSTITVVLNWPTGYLAGKTFTSTLNGVAMGVAVVADQMTLTATDAETAAITGTVEWELIRDFGATEEPVLIGTWVASTDPAAGTDDLTVTVSTDGVSVEMSVFTGELLAEVNNQFIPADQNLIAWTHDPATPRDGSVVTNGTIYLSKLMIREAVEVSGIVFAAFSGVSPVAGQNWVGLYGSNGTRLTQVAVTNLTSVMRTEPVPAVTVPAGFVWVAALFNAATPPTLVRSATTAGLANAGLAAAAYRYATNGTGATVLPASITPANNVSFATAWWFALS